MHGRSCTGVIFVPCMDLDGTHTSESRPFAHVEQAKAGLPARLRHPPLHAWSTRSSRPAARSLHYQKTPAKVDLLIVDELGFAPLPRRKVRSTVWRYPRPEARMVTATLRAWLSTAFRSTRDSRRPIRSVGFNVQFGTDGVDEDDPRRRCPGGAGPRGGIRPTAPTCEQRPEWLGSSEEISCPPRNPRSPRRRPPSW